MYHHRQESLIPPCENDSTDSILSFHPKTISWVFHLNWSILRYTELSRRRWQRARVRIHGIPGVWRAWILGVDRVSWADVTMASLDIGEDDYNCSWWIYSVIILRTDNIYPGLHLLVKLSLFETKHCVQFQASTISTEDNRSAMLCTCNSSWRTRGKPIAL